MTNPNIITTKKNVSRFEEDVRQTGSYAYTADRLSARLANEAMSHAIASAYDWEGKRILDVGCGDGTYTMEFPALGVAEVMGIDPAGVAIEAARAKARAAGLQDLVKFELGNIYELAAYLANDRFDCIVLRGVLHHLPDPAGAIAGLARLNGAVIVLEPNGLNPVLKLIEKVSRYHVEHEERSFSPGLLRRWLTDSGFRIVASKVINLVPMFCPAWIARALKTVGPAVERIPVARDFACGQVVIVAEK